jgi:hypothetical protein
MRHYEQHVPTMAAAQHDPGCLHVGVLRPYEFDLATAIARDPRRCHFVDENLAECTRRSITIKHEFLVHLYPPVGPNLSVLTRFGSWPRSTNARETDSTNDVGPHTKIDGWVVGGNETAASICPSTRRA